MEKPPLDETAGKPEPETKRPGSTPRPAWMGPVRAPSPDRIQVDDTPAAAVFKLVQGDYAAADACIALVKSVGLVDPAAEFGPFTPLLILESIGLVGPAIGHVFHHVCARDPATMLALLHAIRLKVISLDAVKRAAVSHTAIKSEVLIALVREKIPNFATNEMG